MLDYKNIRKSESGKTSIFDIFNGDVFLGELKWYGPWRRYCFYPTHLTLFDESCLLEIVGMIRQQMNYRKEIKLNGIFSDPSNSK